MHSSNQSIIRIISIIGLIIIFFIAVFNGANKVDIDAKSLTIDTKIYNTSIEDYAVYVDEKDINFSFKTTEIFQDYTECNIYDWEFKEVKNSQCSTPIIDKIGIVKIPEKIKNFVITFQNDSANSEVIYFKVNLEEVSKHKTNINKNIFTYDEIKTMNDNKFVQYVLSHREKYMRITEPYYYANIDYNNKISGAKKQYKSTDKKDKTTLSSIAADITKWEEEKQENIKELTKKHGAVLKILKLEIPK